MPARLRADLAGCGASTGREACCDEDQLEDGPRHERRGRRATDREPLDGCADVGRKHGQQQDHQPGRPGGSGWLIPLKTAHQVLHVLLYN